MMGALRTPGGDQEGSWFQPWEDIGGDPVQKATMGNVIGIIPGKKPATRYPFP